MKLELLSLMVIEAVMEEGAVQWKRKKTFAV
jgi:hypothetical protein